jgi:hypothetical protein
MSSNTVEEKITNFLQRKEAEFPELILTGRHGSRTIKYAQDLRIHGQMLLSR